MVRAPPSISALRDALMKGVVEVQFLGGLSSPRLPGIGIIFSKNRN
jgi:hypothetical protein